MLEGGINYHQENAEAGRILMPDLVREFAILGIVVVNVGVFGFSMMDMFHGSMVSAWDRWATFLMASFAMGKSYTLFSFMFGVGLAYQMQSAQRRGVEFAPVYFRRMAGLAVLGLLHAIFFFVGDILVVYALVGCALFAFKDAEPKIIKTWAIWLLVAYLTVVSFFYLIIAAVAVFSPDIMADLGPDLSEIFNVSTDVYAKGSFIEVAGQRFEDFSIMLTGYVIGSGPVVLSFFLFGLHATRQGYLSDAHHPIWQKARRTALPIGLVLSLTGGFLYAAADTQFSAEAAVGGVLITLGAPLSTAGYLGLIAAWAARPRSALNTFMARGGTSTLTAYLLQSIILSIVFSAYGLGLYQELSAGQAIGLALAVGVFTLVVSSLIRTRFRRGPLEWVLRRMTYWKTGLQE